MAVDTVATGANEAVKKWQARGKKMFIDIQKMSYFSKFQGTGNNNIMQVSNDLEGQAGDRIRFYLRSRLSGQGVGENTALEGNEEDLTTYTHDLTLTELAHGVRVNNTLGKQRAMFKMSEEAEDGLKVWITETIDQKAFDALTTSPTKAFYASTATSTATLTTAMKLDTSVISKAKTWAMTGGARSQTPLTPVMVNGKAHYVLLIHPDQAFDLFEDSTWQAAQQYGQIRGDSNPLFTGALGVWNDVIVHVHENIPLATTYGSGANVPGAQAVLMGAQSLVWAWGKQPTITQKFFDYDRQIGYGTCMIYQVNKPKFNSKDFGSAAIYTARTQISDA